MPVMLQGLYRSHMNAGNQYAIATFIALCFMLHARKRKLFSWTSLVMIGLLAGLILSGARTAYVAFAATFLFQFARKRSHFRPLVKFAALALVPVVWFLLSDPAIFSRFASVANFRDRNVTTRFENYREAARDFVKSPLIGIGLGRYNDTGKTYSGILHFLYIATGGEVVNADIQAHDSYLQFLAEGGVVGLFLMLAVWVATYRWAGHLRRRFEEASNAAALCESVQAAVLMAFFSSLTGSTMVMASTPLVVFTIVGLLRNVASYECRARTAKSLLAVGRFGTQAPTPRLGPAEAG
jgi:O-antigen ligase